MFPKDIAIKNDVRLLQMANYVETKGTTCHSDGIKAVFKRFGELKWLVKRGEFTLDQLEDSIYKRYGIIESDENNVDSGFISGMLLEEVKLAGKDIEKYMKKEKREKERKK